jgi:DinB superfamily
MGRPGTNEAAPYYFNYIDKVPSDDVVGFLAAQLDEAMPFLSGISEEKSLHRYAPEKWSIREVLNHVNDGERLFVYRAFWFARGFDTPLPSFDQEVSVAAGKADEVSWADHVEEFRGIRLATLSFFRNLPAEAWDRGGIASDNPFTVRALAYIAGGHFAHHAGIVRERYLGAA